MNKISPLLALLLLVVSCGNGGADRPGVPATATGTEEVARPVGLDIAAIGVHVNDLQTTGGGSDSSDECPRDPGAVAWNSSGTLPGEPGLALIVASAQGVFAHLSDLTPGDLIVVKRADGTQATFKKTDATAPASGTRPARLQLTACDGPTSVNLFSELVP